MYIERLLFMDVENELFVLLFGSKAALGSRWCSPLSNLIG